MLKSGLTVVALSAAFSPQACGRSFGHQNYWKRINCMKRNKLKTWWEATGSCSSIHNLHVMVYVKTDHTLERLWEVVQHVSNAAWAFCNFHCATCWCLCCLCCLCCCAEMPPYVGPSTMATCRATAPWGPNLFWAQKSYEIIKQKKLPKHPTFHMISMIIFHFYGHARTSTSPPELDWIQPTCQCSVLSHETKVSSNTICFFLQDIINIETIQFMQIVNYCNIIVYVINDIDLLCQRIGWQDDSTMTLKIGVAEVQNLCLPQGANVA